LAVVATALLVCEIPGFLSLLIFPLSLVGFAITAVLLLAFCAFSIKKRRPRKAASYLLALALPVLLWRPLIWATECVHLGLTLWLGLGELSATKTSDGKFADYDWSVGLVTNPDTFLIYDATDEVALPMAQHKILARSKSQFVKLCARNARHLIGHYYICSF
jgi:hypothetical protein